MVERKIRRYRYRKLLDAISLVVVVSIPVGIPTATSNGVEAASFDKLRNLGGVGPSGDEA